MSPRAKSDAGPEAPATATWLNNHLKELQRAEKRLRASANGDGGNEGCALVELDELIGSTRAQLEQLLATNPSSVAGTPTTEAVMML